MFDILKKQKYNTPNFIGQFVTILSVNKTREFQMGALRSFFCCHGHSCAIFTKEL